MDTNRTYRSRWLQKKTVDFPSEEISLRTWYRSSSFRSEAMPAQPRETFSRDQALNHAFGVRIQ